MIRRLPPLLIAVTLLATIAAVPAVASAGPASSMRALLRRVTLAAVNDDTAVCPQMTATGRTLYIGVATKPGQHVRSCAAAVRLAHGIYVRHHELTTDRYLLDAALAPTRTAPIKYFEHHHQAVLGAKRTLRGKGTVIHTQVAGLFVQLNGVWTLTGFAFSATG